MHEEIKSKLSLRTASCHSVQSSVIHFASYTRTRLIHRTLIVPLLLHRRESSSYYGKRIDKGVGEQQVTGDWRKLYNEKLHEFYWSVNTVRRSQWPNGLRRGSTAARLLKLRVRIPSGAWMSLYCECCVLPGRRLCDGTIPHPEESYRLRCVIVCDLEKLENGEAKTHSGL